MPAFGSVFTRFGAAVVGLLSGGAASRAVRPIFELVEHQAWHGSPNRLLGPNQLAELVATALTDRGAVLDEAQRQGLRSTRLDALVQLALTTPTIGQAMDARRRGVITAGQYQHVLRKAGIEPQYDDAMVELLELLPPPSDLVLFGVREVYSPEQRAALDLDAEFPSAIVEPARALGLSEATIRRYWAAHWDLPSYEQLVEMHFRGELTRAELENALRAIDYAPTWRGKLLAIARRIPTPTDFQRLARRGVYTPAERTEFDLDAEFPEAFADKMALHGMTRSDALDLWAGGWRLPSARQLYQMLWRHEITEAQLDVGLRALDYPRFWRRRLANVARPVPPRVAIAAMLRAEVVTPEEGHEMFMQLGYTDDHAGKLVAIAVPGADDDAGGGSFVSKARAQLWSRLHSEYVTRQLTADEATAGLASAGVPAAQRGPVVTLWTAEREFVRTELTQAQIVKAAKKGELSEEEAFAELVERGMSERDAGIRLRSG